MNRRARKCQKESRLKSILYMHISSNIKEYIIVSILFIIGVIAGVIFINNMSDAQQLEIDDYITSFINYLKNSPTINDFAVLKDSVLKNIGIAMLLWFMGSTIIGISIVYLIVAFRGFVLGYTISSFILILGIGKSLLIIIPTLFLKNILIIPSIFCLAVSGIKLHNSIMKDRRKENIKTEILTHSIFCLIVSLILIIASLIEVYMSNKILIYFSAYL